MIDWAGLRAVRDWSAQWIRIDVWTTNEALRNYYEKRGFRFCRECPFDQDTYPSGALFQKPTSEVDEVAAARFAEPSIIAADLIGAHPELSLAGAAAL
jgi:hypothetical protein